MPQEKLRKILKTRKDDLFHKLFPTGWIPMNCGRKEPRKRGRKGEKKGGRIEEINLFNINFGGVCDLLIW